MTDPPSPSNCKTYLPCTPKTVSISALTGFDPAEIDVLLANLVDPENGLGDEVPAIAAKAVSRIGDMWLLGLRHRLLCGTALQADYERLMARALAAMVATDPPYNVSIPQTVGRGHTKHPNFAMACGEMSSTARAGRS